ncbi:MAG: hypothetical protein ACKVP5_18795 [Aestuariivirga sp.]
MLAPTHRRYAGIVERRDCGFELETVRDGVEGELATDEVDWGHFTSPSWVKVARTWTDPLGQDALIAGTATLSFVVCGLAAAGWFGNSTGHWRERRRRKIGKPCLTAHETGLRDFSRANCMKPRARRRWPVAQSRLSYSRFTITASRYELGITRAA